MAETNGIADCGKTSGCLLEGVHRRMEDAHSLWHQCLDEYFSPDKFRLALQSCIPVLRSVTFLLQNQKHAIPNFESWYEQWQQRMRADKLMRWLVDSRNTIEKQGDLETRSSVRAEIIATYTDTLPVVEIKGDLFESLESLLSRVPKALLESHILEHGIFRIERRWVADTLPEVEILDALAEAFGKLSQVVDDAHTQIGLPVPFLIHPNRETIVPVAGGGPSGGRLPCMIGHDNRRSIQFSLKTGDRIVLAYESIDEAEARRAAMESYGHLVIEPQPMDESLLPQAEWLFSRARQLFLTDGYHISLAVLFCGHDIVNITRMNFENRSDKYLVMRELATAVDRANADAVVLIGEAWSAVSAPNQPFFDPSDSPEKREYLHLWACSANGEVARMFAEIIRGESISLGETMVAADDPLGMFKPIRDIWNKHRSRA